MTGMPCEACKNERDIEDLSYPYVIRTCATCGREWKARDAASVGKGFPRIEQGERLVIPDGFLQFSANPLKGKGHLTKQGVDWYAKHVFIANLPQKLEEFDKVIEENERYCFDRIQASELLKNLDIENPEHREAIWERLEANQDAVVWWHHWFGIFNAVAQRAIEDNDARKAAWAMACAERCRSMVVFKEHFEEVVWMGHSAKRLVEVISTWDSNKLNADEGFWQTLFTDNPYIISQLFSVPVVFINKTIYVGGMNVDRQLSRFLDFLYTTETAKDAILVEIKTPCTSLLGSKYRTNVFTPSSELTGAIVQVLDYRRTLGRSLEEKLEGTEHIVKMFNPRCVIIAGNAEGELTGDIERRSFELYRRQLRDVEIVTYDELFKKAETLATLFNIVRKEQP